jgi:hypothetical protein
MRFCQIQPQKSRGGNAQIYNQFPYCTVHLKSKHEEEQNICKLEIPRVKYKMQVKPTVKRQRECHHLQTNKSQSTHKTAPVIQSKKCTTLVKNGSSSLHISKNLMRGCVTSKVAKNGCKVTSV